MTLPRANIELKARFANLARGHEIANHLEAQRQPAQTQVDTYFRCERGRLKLREINSTRAELIWYCRENSAESKQSNYTLVPVADPAALKQALTGAYGEWLVVEKHREIYLWQNVRIHLDDVRQLGTFLEFEAVLSEQHVAGEGHRQLEYLTEQFELAPTDLLEGSYSDLLARQQGLIE